MRLRREVFFRGEKIYEEVSDVFVVCKKTFRAKLPTHFFCPEFFHVNRKFDSSKLEKWCEKCHLAQLFCRSSNVVSHMRTLVPPPIEFFHSIVAYECIFRSSDKFKMSFQRFLQNFGERTCRYLQETKFSPGIS